MTYLHKELDVCAVVESLKIFIKFFFRSIHSTQVFLGESFHRKDCWNCFVNCDQLQRIHFLREWYRVSRKWGWIRAVTQWIIRDGGDRADSIGLNVSPFPETTKRSIPRFTDYYPSRFQEIPPLQPILLQFNGSSECLLSDNDAIRVICNRNARRTHVSRLYRLFRYLMIASTNMNHAADIDFCSPKFIEYLYTHI